ncbi:MAG TPA: OmpH family outer membrane protein [Crocinitomicaceae bacterium]|nr:OmpH family outer membrane protein [Crocinitomicaceae bacterium]
MKKLILAILVVVSAGTLSAQSSVAHVNSQVLLDTLPSRKAAIVKLQEFEAAGMKELKEMEQDFQQGVAKYQAALSGMSPVIQKIEEEKLMKKQQGLQDREQSFQQEMQVYSNELNTPILDMVQKAVKVVSERKKINYVIDESVTLYFAGGTDITDEVIKELLKMDK